MNDSDFAEFSEVWEACYENYGKAPTPRAINMAFDVLSRFELSQVTRALTAHMNDTRQGQFAPKPADVVRNIEGTPDDAALEAWGKVDFALRRHGTGPAWIFDDPKIHYVLQAMGGTAQLATMDERDFGFFREQFCKRYAGDGDASHYPNLLPGWYTDGSRALIGNEHECLAVIEGGNEQPKKQVTNASEIGQALLDGPGTTFESG